MELYVGLSLMVLGIVLFFVGRSRSRTVRVEASDGSVAVGGKNSGSITNLNVGSPAAAAHGSHLLTYVSIRGGTGRHRCRPLARLAHGC